MIEAAAGLLSTSDRTNQSLWDRLQTVVARMGGKVDSERKEIRHAFVTISGGVGEVAESPEDVKIHLIDYDNITEDPAIAKEWLSDLELEFIRKNDPDTFKEISEA